MNSRTYRVGRSQVVLRFGDITTSGAEVLVSSDDFYVTMGGGVSAAILAAGGKSIATQASKLVPAKAGDVLVTSAGGLPARYVLHAITLGDSSQERLPGSGIVRQCVRKVMRLLPLLSCRSVAFPAIGAGVARIPYEVVASEMASVLVEALLDSRESLTVELYLMDRFGQMTPGDFFMFFEQFATRTMGVESHESGEIRTLTPPEAAVSMSQEQRLEAERRHNVFTMLRHLDERRSQIESSMLDHLSGKAGTGDYGDWRRQLEDLQQLRTLYERELGNPTQGAGGVVPRSVFVSSTSQDMQSYRQAVHGVIKKLNGTYVGMEEFSASPDPPADLIRRKVTETQHFVGLLGLRYGHVDPVTEFSMTELEYRQAVASGKPVYMFVLDEDAYVQARMVESDPTKLSKLRDFRSRVMTKHVCQAFRESGDLAEKVEKVLAGAI